MRSLLLVLVVLHGIVAFSGQNEVSRDELGTLVKKLIEGMLSVSCGFSEEDRTGGVFDVVAAARNCFTV